MSPIDHFLTTYRTRPSVLEQLSLLEKPYNSDGVPRGLNKTTLAELAGVTYPVVHRTELALFEKIPPKLLLFMERHSPYYEDYPKMYRNYRTTLEARSILEEKGKARRNGKHWIVEDPEDVLSVPILSFYDWRKRHFETVMGMAKVILINPTIIANYECGKTQELPVGVKRQFVKFGMSQNLIKQIAKLEHAYNPDPAKENAEEADINA